MESDDWRLIPIPNCTVMSSQDAHLVNEEDTLIIKVQDVIDKRGHMKWLTG